MSWHTLYQTSDGAFIGHGQGPAPDPLPAGQSVLTHSERQDQENVWVSGTTSWSPRPASREIAPKELLRRLTVAERADYNTKVAAGNGFLAIVEQARKVARDMDETINLDHPTTIQMVDLLVQEGVITLERKPQILA